MVSSIIGESSGNTILIKSMFRKYSKKVSNFLLKNLFLLKRYNRFPIYATPSQIIGAFSSQMPVFFLSVIYGSQVTGYYGLAFSIINLPMMLIGESFGNVFYSEAASLKNVNVEKIKDLSQKFLKKLFIFGLIPFVILLLFGPFLFSFVFGDQWYEAGQISRVLSFLMFFRLVFTPISRIYSIFERQKEAFIIDIVRTLILALFFILTLILKFDYIFTLLIYSFISSFFSFIVFVVAQKIINNEIKNNN